VVVAAVDRAVAGRVAAVAQAVVGQGEADPAARAVAVAAARAVAAAAARAVAAESV
jgi:hypothetical protein